MMTRIGYLVAYIHLKGDVLNICGNSSTTTEKHLYNHLDHVNKKLIRQTQSLLSNIVC